MPIYEYRCERVRGAVRGVPLDLDKPRATVPGCGVAKRGAELSRINTEWLPSDVAWDRVGRSWD